MENQVLKTKVVIVGAGPTGLSMAAQLTRYGIDFIITEKNEKTTILSKAVVVQARSMEIFDELGIAEEAIKRGRMTTAIRLFYKGRQKVGVDFARFGEGMSAFPFALSLEQSKTETLLAEYLSKNGEQVNWKSEFSHFVQHENGVSVFCNDSNGTIRQIDAQYLIGCDGSSSPVRHQLGCTFEGDTIPKIFYVADVTLKSPVINKDELFMYLIKKGFILFFPMEGEGHYRIIGILPDADEDHEQYQFSDIQESIKAQIISPVEFEEIKWFATYKVHSRMANIFNKGNVFIAGDAAHIHTPAGGQGMNTGIQDAYNLAWKLALVIRGEAKPQLLETYNAERLQNAKHLLQTTDRIFDIMAGTTGFMNFLRLRIFPKLMGFMVRTSFLKKRFFPLLSQIGIAYPDSSLSVKSSLNNIKAGDRMPYFVFSDGSQIYGYLNKPTFKLLFFGNPTNNDYKTRVDLKIKISTYSFGEIPAAFEKHKDFYILLRPDNHISYIGNEMEKCDQLLVGISNGIK
ncbi:MAG TPA: FAD-dependent monooxygenase [Flavobacterium sp.]|nr:FAD-dependent monooxygenase [Flavobacterium sp.]